MQLPLTLQTRIGRRIALMFVLSALLPVAVLAVIAYVQVRDQLRSQAKAQLEEAVRSVGMGLAGQLDDASNTLLQAASEMQDTERSRQITTLTTQRARSMFAALAVVAAGTARPLWGDSPRLSLISAHGAAPGGDAAHMQVDSAGPQVWIVVSSGAGSTLWGAVQSAFLFRNSANRARAGANEADLCVRIEGIPSPLRCSRPDATTARLSETWRLFLGRSFRSASWDIEVSQPIATVLAPLAQFRNYFGFSILAALGLVILLSSMQVRRSLQPVTELRLGTSRIAQRDFSRAVSVKSGDEFEDLATSFNQMASEINQQFRTITAISDIDQVALVSHRAHDVALTAAGRLDDMLRGKGVADVYLAGERRDAAWTCVRATGSETGEAFTMTEADRDRLSAARGGWVRDAKDFRWIHADGQGEIAVLPLISHEELIGAIALRGKGPLAEDQFVVARQLGDQLALGLSNSRLIVRLNGFSYGAIAAFGRTVDANSPWTAGHSERVTSLAIRLGSYLSLPEREMDTLHRGGLLHDIGKIGVSPFLLDKAGPLTEGEIVIMREHPDIGARILAPVAAFEDIVPIVRHHHEKLDGSGYPDGLRGNKIPHLARLLAVADVYDALVSDRPYRRGWESSRAIEQIVSDAGTHFDPVMVNAFVAVMASEGDMSRFVLAPLETAAAVA